MLIFDGDCAMCSAAARWVSRGWRSPASSVSSAELTDDRLRALGLSRREAQQAAWWVDEGGRLAAGHLAIGEALCRGGALRHAAGRMLMTRAIGTVAAPLYRALARHRHPRLRRRVDGTLGRQRRQSASRQ